MPNTLHIVFITSFTAQYMAWLCTSTIAIVLHPILAHKHPETLFQMLFLAAVSCNALHFVFGDTQLYRHVKAIFVLTNCYGITDLFFTKINFHWKSDLYTKIFYYENLELYGIIPVWEGRGMSFIHKSPSWGSILLVSSSSCSSCQVTLAWLQSSGVAFLRALTLHCNHGHGLHLCLSPSINFSEHIPPGPRGVIVPLQNTLYSVFMLSWYRNISLKSDHFSYLVPHIVTLIIIPENRSILH